MSYDFKRLVDVELIDNVPDDAEIFCIVNDEVKKINKNNLGIKGGSDNGTSVNTDEFGAIYIRYPENDEDMEIVTDILDEFHVIDWISSVIENEPPEQIWNNLNDMYNNGEQFPFCYRDEHGNIFNIEINTDAIRATLYRKLIINFNETLIQLLSVIYDQQYGDYSYITNLDSISTQLEEIDSNGVICQIEEYGKLTDKFKEETNIIGLCFENNEMDSGFFEEYIYFVYEDDYFNNCLVKKYINGGKIIDYYSDGQLVEMNAEFDVRLVNEPYWFDSDDKIIFQFIEMSSPKEDVETPFSVMEFLHLCADENVLGEIDDEQKDSLSHMFFRTSHDDYDITYINLIPKSLADNWGYDNEHIQL